MKEFVSFQGRTFGPQPGLCPGPTGGGGLLGSPQTSFNALRSENPESSTVISPCIHTSGAFAVFPK
jgi:hypothetical protein